MIIAGIDPSINGTGLCKLYLDDDLEIDDMDYKGFSTVKKHASDNIIHFRKKDFCDNIEQYIFTVDHILDFCDDVDYVCIEDYAYAATGQTFNIGEFVGYVKIMMFEHGKKIRMLEPTVMKKFATLYGNADKTRMEDEYMKNDVLNIQKNLPEYKSPKIDIVDAYFLAKFLQLEMKLRYGLLEVKDLPLKHIEIFNKVTKSNPVNILARDFLEKE